MREIELFVNNLYSSIPLLLSRPTEQLSAWSSTKRRESQSLFSSISRFTSETNYCGLEVT